MDRDDNHIDLFLLNRKGFVKRALKHGADLVPTFTFGEAFIFSNMFSNSKGSLLRKMQLDVTRKTGCPVPLFFGRALFNYSFGPLPRRQPLTVVGKIFFFKNTNFIFSKHTLFRNITFKYIYLKIVNINTYKIVYPSYYIYMVSSAANC